MSTVFRDPLLGDLNRSWGWIVTLGVIFIVAGIACVVADVSATRVTVLFFGWMLLISGVIALVNAFGAGNWRGSLLYFCSALLRGITGYLLVRYPEAGAASLTLVLASFFVVGGLFRAIGAGMIQFPRWGWVVFSGILSVVLGVLLLVQLPNTSVWFIGLAIGIDLIVDGSSLIGFGAAVHQLAGHSEQRLA